MNAIEQRGVDRMVDAAVRFANRIAELEAYIRELEAKLKARTS